MGILAELNSFWIYQKSIDFLYVSWIFALLVFLLCLKHISSVGEVLSLKASDTVVHQKFSQKILQFGTPYYTYCIFRLLSVVLLSLLAFSYLLKAGLIPQDLAYCQVFRYVGSFLAGLLLLFVMQEFVYFRFRATYMPNNSELRLVANSFAVECIGLMMKFALLTALLCRVVTAESAKYILLVSFTLFFLVRIVMTVCSLLQGYKDILYVFLYLCVREILPIVYLYFGVEYIIGIIS